MLLQKSEVQVNFFHETTCFDHKRAKKYSTQFNTSISNRVPMDTNFQNLSMKLIEVIRFMPESAYSSLLSVVKVSLELPRV